MAKWGAEARMRALLWYFGLAYGISWLVVAPLWLPALGIHGLPVLPYHHSLASFGPAGAAIIVTGAREGRAGISGLFSSLVTVPRNRWLAGLALLGPFALLAIAYALAVALGQPAEPSTLMHSANYPGFSPFALFVLYLFTFGIGEEMGWRGFALPRLQERWSPFTATLVLSAGWALWHWPFFLYWPGMRDLGLGGGLGWFVSLWLGAMILTWFYNRSGGSLLVVALFHASVNTVFAADDPASFVPMAIGVMITLLGIGAAYALWRDGKARSGA
jgi:CAAX protease family protein